MLQRLRSAFYAAPDLASAKRFYTALLDFAPYFDEPFYVGYEVHGCELGLVPDGELVTTPVAYWKVDALEGVLARVVALGGRRHSEPEDVGGGISKAIFVDPAGNQVGIIEERAAAHG
jgi:predicted enzyme related to lactoylglutathione lyase